jgi:hypothetical protein
MGVRTMREIDEERQALKVLRGDFRDVAAGGDQVQAGEIVAAVER